MIIVPGSTSVSRTISIRDAGGQPVTGLTYLTAPQPYFSINGSERLPISLVAVDTNDPPPYPWISGGILEASSGRYRLDIPNVLLATANSNVQIFGYDGTNEIFVDPIDVVDFAALLLDKASAVETYTPRQLLRGMFSAMLGKTTDGQTKFRDKADTKDRIAATIDSGGDRSGVTLDLT